MMIQQFQRGWRAKVVVLFAVLCIAAALDPTQAADIIKANNTDALNLGTSWTLGATPGTGDVGVWDSTVTGPNSTAYGADLSWQGIRIADPGGLVTLGTSGATQTLTLGTAGVDMASATQNLLLNGNVDVATGQTWNVAAGRTLQLFTINTARTLTGSSQITLANATGSGTATFDLRPGTSGSTSFSAQAGVSGFTGDWYIGPNTIVKTLRNGINAWGTGTVFLAGGRVGQQQNFSGSWTNTMELVAGTNSTIDDFNNSGTRYLQLNGLIQGTGNLTFQDTNGSVTTTKDVTYTLAAANTMSGTVTIASNAFLRVGGVGGNTNTASSGVPTAGTQGTLGTAAVVNNGGLSFTRTDSWTAANAISGTGSVNIGSQVSQLATTATQNVTLSGISTYSGATTIYTGTLTVTGSLASGSAVSVASGATLAGTGAAAGTISVASGGILSPGVANAGTLTTGSLTFGTAASNTASIVMPVSAGGTLDSQLAVTGDVVANGGAGTVTFGLGSNLALLGPGTYTLMSYTGALNDFSAFTYSGTSGARQDVNLVNGSQSIDLQVGPNAFVTWSGAAGSDWTAANNWILSSDGQPTSFQANDAVVFDDSGATGTVDLSADVNPLTITFSGNTLAYTIGSAGTSSITTGSLIKTGSATVTINTANSFAGGTQLTGGTLVLGNDASLGTGGVSLEGGTLDLNGRAVANAVTLAGGTIEGNGGTLSSALAETGGARTLVVGSSLTLLANNTYTGGTTVNAGTLTVGNGGTAGALGTGAISVAAGAEIVFNRSNAFTVSDTISGVGTLTKAGGGRMTVNGNNSGGAVNWNFAGTGNGDIGFSNANALGGSGSTMTLDPNATGSVFFATSGNTSDVGISLGSGAVLTWNGSTGNTSTLSGVIAGDGGLTKVSGETLRLTGVNTYTGPTTVTTGTIEIGGGGVLGGGSYAGAVSLAARLSMNTTANQTLSGAITGGGSLFKSNTGTLTLSGTNTYSGGTELLGGTLEVSGLSGIGAGYLAVKNGATFSYQGSGSETTTRNLFLDLGASRIDVTQATGSLTWNDAAAKNGDFTKGGAGALAIGGGFSGGASITVLDGSLALGGASTYTGPTTVSGGTLFVNGSLANTSGVSVASGAVLGGTGSMAAAISGAGLVSPGNSPGITTATAVDPTGGLGFAFEFTATGSPDYTNASASVNDVLRLTDGTTPFNSSLSGANGLDIYFDVSTLSGGDTFKGGFYTDLQSDFLTTVENGSYSYWVKGDGTGTDRTFNGQGYFSLANFDSGLSVTLATVAETAAFAGGTANGQVMEFSVVPEPTTITLAAAAVGFAGWHLARRRRR